MTTKTCKTHWVKIYSSGPIEIAKQVCREYCLSVGLCVTIEPTLYIYTGGEESGFVVGIVNYPRFPSNALLIDDKAEKLAMLLLERCAQHSVMFMTPTDTAWITKRAEEKAPIAEPKEKCIQGHQFHDYQMSSPIDTVEVCTRCGHRREA